MVVILAAGRGSRSELPLGVSKCAVPLTGELSFCSVSRLISQVIRFSSERCFVVVVGYAGSSVQDKVEQDLKETKDISIKFVCNPYWEERGSGKSLSSVKETLLQESPDIVYLFEGDSVYSDKNISQMFSNEYSSPYRVLVRPMVSSISNDNTFRSVGLIEHKNTAISFIYSTFHSLQMENISRCSNLTVSESMQCWSLPGDALLESIDYVESLYKKGCLKDDTNLGQINYILRGICVLPIVAKDPEGWINLNTSNDRYIAKKKLEGEYL